MRRFYLALVVVAATALAPSPIAAAPRASCVLDNHHASVVLFGDAHPLLWRDSIGRIYLNNDWCDGAATVTNTDLISINGDSGNQEMWIYLDNGRFQPGWTNEPGTSDEIEFKVNLGGGPFDELNIVGTDKVDRIDLGQNNAQFGLVHHINLNSGESTGIDSDMAVTNVEWVGIQTKGDNDVVRAQGGSGTGPDPYGLPLVIDGGGGADQIKGGSSADQLLGGKGVDTIWGMKGNDSLDLSDGAGGDVGHGGAGLDTCTKDGGDTCDQL